MAFVSLRAGKYATKSCPDSEKKASSLNRREEDVDKTEEEGREKEES
jgi:hypothetical protein